MYTNNRNAVELFAQERTITNTRPRGATPRRQYREDAVEEIRSWDKDHYNAKLIGFGLTAGMVLGMIFFKFIL